MNILSRVEDVQVKLKDEKQPFGTASSGEVTLAGPFKRVSRLYGQSWTSSVSQFERYLSEIVESEYLNQQQNTNSPHHPRDTMQLYRWLRTCFRSILFF